MKPIVIAHRGASGITPENSIMSFEEALNQGADGVEFDIHFTRDRVPVVIHDGTLDRTTTGQGKISEHSLDEIKKYKITDAEGNVFADQQVPTLKETLEIVKTMSVINIEIKSGNNEPSAIKQIIEMAKVMGIFSNIIFSSFDHYLLHKVKTLAPGARIGLLYKCKLYRPWEYAAMVDADNLHPYYRSIDKNITGKCKNNNVSVNVYGVNDKKSIKQAIKSNVDMLITDYPDLAKQIIAGKI
ncbi:MAG: glycerophosphodiester phosphodiesterase [Halanaerobiaceae bacterium]